MIPRAFLRLDSASIEDMVTDAAVHALADGGVPALSTRAVAEWLKVTPARVSQMASRDELTLFVTARFAQRWIQWIEWRRSAQGPRALLPDEPGEVAGVRVWLALHELSRTRPELAEILEGARRRERAILADLLGMDADAGELTLIGATVEGLRARLCHQGDALPLTAARSTLDRLLALLGVQSSHARPA